MLELADGMILYHGSYCKVAKPELEKCAKRKDFGRGFYLTSSKEQAVSFLKTSILKAAASGKIGTDQTWGYVSKFRVDLKKNLTVIFFKTQMWIGYIVLRHIERETHLMRLKKKCRNTM